MLKQSIGMTENNAKQIAEMYPFPLQSHLLGWQRQSSFRSNL